MAAAPPKDHRSSSAPRSSPPGNGGLAADSDKRRRRSTSAFSAGQLRQPYSRATASWAADNVTCSETARSLVTARGSPYVAARSSSRA